MMSFSTIKSAGSAAGYYSNNDNYYVLGSLESRWEGKGAEELGLEGQVENAQLTELLQGRLPDGSSLSRKIDAIETHRPGYDLTFSAPKSVSMMALIGGDRRLIGAHDAAVSVALEEIQELASARVTSDKVTRIELTGNIIAAIFNHDTSRDLDPQLHSHALIMNATKTENGWRALSTDTKTETGFSETVMANQVVLGNIYRRALRTMVEAMGYETEASGKNGLWEMKDLPTSLFSQRSHAIDAAVGENASPKSRDVAALDTRKKKVAADPAQLLTEWKARLTVNDFDIVAYRDQAAEREFRAECERIMKDPAVQTLSAIDFEDVQRRPVLSAPVLSDRGLTDEAVKNAISVLSDNAVRFTYSDLLAKSATQLPAEPGTFAAIRTSIDGAIEHQRLIPLDKEKGIFTSDIHLLNELSITVMSRELTQSGRALQFDDRSKPHQGPWSDVVTVMRQDRPMIAVLEGQGGARIMRDRIAEVMDMAQDMGREVNVLAADHKSHRWLSEDPQFENSLLSRSQCKEGITLPLQSTLIIDQAEKLNLKETLMLLDEALKQSVQLIFMDSGKRQGTGNALEVVKSSDASIYRFADGRQAQVNLISEPDKRNRYGQLSAEFVSRHVAGEAVVAQVNGTREQKLLTANIRSALKERGQLGNERSFQVMSPVYLTSKTRRLRENYREGMVMEQWNGDEKTMARWFVRRVGEQTNTLTLERGEGESRTIKISQLDSSWSLFRAETISLAPGDRLCVTGREEKGKLRAGELVKVASVSPTGITVTASGKDITLDSARGLKLRYGYVESLGSSVSDRTRVLAAVAKRDMSNEGLNQLSRSGEHISLYTSLDAERARVRLASSPHFKLASEHIKDNAAEQDLDKAILHQKTGLYSEAELAVRLGSNIAQAKHRSGIVFSSLQLLDEAARSGGNVSLRELKDEINRQVKEGELLRFDVIRGTGVSMMVQRASYEMERSIVRHIVEGKAAVQPLIQKLPEGALSDLTPGQQKASQLILQSTDRFIAIQGYAGVGKTTQLKAVIDALSNLPKQDVPEIIGLAPTHRAVLEMQSVGVRAQTHASFLAEEKQKVNSGEQNRYTGKLFLVDESSMVGNRDMADVCQLIADGGGRAVLSGDILQLKSPESGIPFAMQQQRSPIDVAVMKDIVRQTPELKKVVYNMIEGNHRAALNQVESIQPDVVPRKAGAWVPASSVVEIRRMSAEASALNFYISVTEKCIPADVTDAVAMDYAGRTPAAQRDSIVITQTNDDRNEVNKKIHALRHQSGETGQKEHRLDVLTRVNTQRDELRTPTEWVRHKGKYAFIDNAFWTVRNVDTKAGVVSLLGDDGNDRLLSVRENSTRDASVWEVKAITVSKGDRLRFSATDNERGYVANSVWDISSVDERGQLTLSSGEMTRVINPTADKHDSRIDLAYAVTTHGSQGASERYSISLQGVSGKRGRLVSQDNSYVQLSRAKEHMQVYTDHKKGWLKRLGETSERLSAYDILEAESDRSRQVGNGIYERAVPAYKTGLGRKMLRDAGVEGEFKGRFVSASAKYPQPHIALPLYDNNGREAGVLLSQIRCDAEGLTFTDGSRRVGAGRFAGFQHSQDGNVSVVTSYKEAIEVAKNHPQTGIMIRLEGYGSPWNMQRIMGGMDKGDLAKDVVAVASKREGDPIPFIKPEEERHKQEIQKKAIERASAMKMTNTAQGAIKQLAGEAPVSRRENALSLPAPENADDKVRGAIEEIARQNLTVERLQHIEREIVRDKTLGE